MQPILFILLIGLAGGIAVGLQGPLASTITQKMGMMESAFIVHIGGAVAALHPGFYERWKTRIRGKACPGRVLHRCAGTGGAQRGQLCHPADWRCRGHHQHCDGTVAHQRDPRSLGWRAR